MKKMLLVSAIVLATQGVLFAQETVVEIAVKNSDSAWALFLSAALAIGLAALGASRGMGQAIGSAVESISRNPGVADRIFTTMIIGLALIESIAIYALVVSLILLFVV